LRFFEFFGGSGANIFSSQAGAAKELVGGSANTPHIAIANANREIDIPPMLINEQAYEWLPGDVWQAGHKSLRR
jgi:hypothetical protein